MLLRKFAITVLLYFYNSPCTKIKYDNIFIVTDGIDNIFVHNQ